MAPGLLEDQSAEQVRKSLQTVLKLAKVTAHLRNPQNLQHSSWLNFFFLIANQTIGLPESTEGSGSCAGCWPRMFLRKDMPRNSEIFSWCCDTAVQY
jgi:hypothetical protein